MQKDNDSLQRYTVQACNTLRVAAVDGGSAVIWNVYAWRGVVRPRRLEAGRYHHFSTSL